GGGRSPTRNDDGDGDDGQKRRDAPEQIADHSLLAGDGARRRSPLPPPRLTAPSSIRSMPATFSAPTSFISESTLPRISPSLASIRWMVGTDRPESSASRL